MILAFRRLIAYGTLFVVLGLFAGSSDTEQGQQMTVHVLLDKKSETTGQLWVLYSSQGFWLSDPLNATCREKISSAVCAVTYEQDHLIINGKKLAHKRIKIEPVGEYAKVNDRKYTGSLTVLFGNSLWHLVNSIDLESYVESVLCAESWPNWPLEVNKAFAIAMRSFVVAQLLQARAKKKRGKDFFFDIGCTNLHQTYKGMPDCPEMKEAVDETRGMVLAYHGKPITAMYDVCCGGVIPSQIKGVDFSGSPYLARSYPCTFCADCKMYGWKARYTLAECERLLHRVDPTVTQVRDIKITAVDQAGVVHQCKVKCGKWWRDLSAKAVYSAFKDIKSFCFEVGHRGNSIVFDGRGYGHHKGMCQWGAREMVRQGWSYQQVLDFYYPNTKIMKLAIV